jgi:hypothetical protein
MEELPLEVQEWFSLQDTDDEDYFWIEENSQPTQNSQSTECSQLSPIISQSDEDTWALYSLEKLPFEVLAHICSFLSFQCLQSLSLVSKRLYQVANDDSIWRKYFTLSFGETALSAIPFWKVDYLKEKKIKEQLIKEQNLASLENDFNWISMKGGVWKTLYYEKSKQNLDYSDSSRIFSVQYI